MRLLEHQSKEILTPGVIKAQIPIGGRQKAGGILEALDQKEAEYKL